MITQTVELTVLLEQLNRALGLNGLVPRHNYWVKNTVMQYISLIILCVLHGCTQNTFVSTGYITTEDFMTFMHTISEELLSKALSFTILPKGGHQSEQYCSRSDNSQPA